MPRQGECLSLVTAPAARRPRGPGCPGRGMPGPVKTKGTSFSGLGSSRSASAPMKPVSELAAPAEPGLDRVAVLGEVVAVQVEADLEAQRVAGGEADRRHARSSRASHTAVGAVRRDQQLDAVLAGVAGAADEALNAGDPCRSACASGSVAPRALDHRRGARAPGPRSSRSSCSETSTSKSHACSRNQAMSFRGWTRWYGDEALRPELVGEEVVEDAAVLTAQHRVLRAADRRSRVRRSRAALEELLGVRAARLDLAHVRDVEQADARRTATCSWRMPAYWTGISQPANGTSRAPAARGDRTAACGGACRRRAATARRSPPVDRRRDLCRAAGTGRRRRQAPAIPRTADPAYVGVQHAVDAVGRQTKLDVRCDGIDW